MKPKGFWRWSTISAATTATPCKAEKSFNADEYAEMTEFSARSLELFGKLQSADGDKARIENDLKALAAHIANKTGDNAVPQLAQQIKDRLIRTYDIITYPKSLPIYESARLIYTQNCAQRHGEGGKGDGPARESMEPKTPAPANLLIRSSWPGFRRSKFITRPHSGSRTRLWRHSRLFQMSNAGKWPYT